MKKYALLLVFVILIGLTIVAKGQGGASVAPVIHMTPYSAFVVVCHGGDLKQFESNRLIIFCYPKDFGEGDPFVVGNIWSADINAFGTLPGNGTLPGGGGTLPSGTLKLYLPLITK